MVCARARACASGYILFLLAVRLLMFNTHSCRPSAGRGSGHSPTRSPVSCSALLRVHSPYRAWVCVRARALSACLSRGAERAIVRSVDGTSGAGQAVSDDNGARCIYCLKFTGRYVAGPAAEGCKELRSAGGQGRQRDGRRL